MKPRKIDHICIAVRSLDAARPHWEQILGKGPDEEYTDEPEQIHVLRYMVGEVGLELMESTTPDGPVARHIAKHGEGVMVLSLGVESTAAAVEELSTAGLPLVPAPDTGEVLRPFRGGHFAFVHPRAVNGVLLELIDEGLGE